MNDPLKKFEVDTLYRLWSLPSPPEDPHTYRSGCICVSCTTTRAKANSILIDLKARMSRPDNG